MKHARAFGSLALALVLLGTLVAVAGSASPPRKLTRAATTLTPDSTFDNAKSVSGSYVKTDPSLLGATGSNPINVMIKYDYDATASYAGGLSGLAATSPATTGESLEANGAAVEKYENHTARVSSKISSAVTNAVPSAQINRAFQTVYGGVAATVPANSVADLLEVDGVVAVQKDSLEQPQTSVTPEFTGASAVWPSIGGPIHGGENVIVGVLDTGIWPEHPSFADQGLPAPPSNPTARPCDFGDGTDVIHLGPAFTCNDKLIGAKAFLSTYLAVFGALPGEYCNTATGKCSARDADGHGTHTASTAAGGPVASTSIFGINRGAISGMAPGARVIMYRVCLEQGCFQSDSIAGIQQAIRDGVDVINFSIGGGANPYTDAVEVTFLDAFDAGISVNASAGNEGPGPATASHGGPWVTTVGASTGPRSFQSTLHLTAGGATFSTPGVTITPGIAPTPIVLASSISPTNAQCLTPFAAGAATGKIVACQGPPRNRAVRGYNVMNAGGAGMVLYNQTHDDLFTDNHWLPAIQIDGPSDSFLAFLTGHTGVTATWTTGAPTARQADVMTTFSSRGPVGDFLKPDVTAPGIQILAGNTPTPVAIPAGPPGQYFQVIAGTSMSSPHSAGASAVVKAAHPDWTPAMIKSALMTSAAQDVFKQDGVTPFDPFDAGAGSIRVDRAVDPTLVFDETTAHFDASAADPLHRIDLNLASIDATTMTGEITTKRTAINVSGKEQDLKVETSAPDGVTIYVSDKAPGPKGPKSDNTIRLNKNGTTDIWITISAPDVEEGQYFGRITLDPQGKATEVTMPVAFFKRQGVVTLTHTCAPTTFPKRSFTRCNATVSNFSSIAADVSLTVTNLDKGRGLDFTHIVAPATAIKRNDGVQWDGTLTPSIAPTIDSLTPVTDPNDKFGYIPLAVFGIGPISGVGDETIANFNVPPFYYGAEQYTRIGVVSDGYVVVGGGQGPDVEFIPQKPLPNPARPNNVVAPVWSDLNPAFGGAIRIGVLTDNVNNFIVVDFAGVRNYSGTVTHTFSIVFQTADGAAGPGPESELVRMSYGPGPANGPTGGNAATGDPDAGVNWGAENRDGSSGKDIASAPANGSEYDVGTSGPTPGGSATITYDAEAKHEGVYRSVASMTSNVTPGKTQEVVTLTVTR